MAARCRPAHRPGRTADDNAQRPNTDSSAAVEASAGFVLAACGSDGATAAVSMCKTDGAKDGGINDPTHHLVVPGADISAGVSKTYSIKGTQTHDHEVTLEAADFANLGADTTVTVTSTATLGHSHTFDVVCA